ncbi:MAG: hypothetical protein KDA58_15265, partial [Planctomycetaceae bacterium]|nr:hypothetical protein [Planctomycetaceae bacterium]
DVSLPTDNDSPTLTLSIDLASISENGGVATGTVTRNTPAVGDLVVTLSSDDTGEATVPATVTILNGQTSAEFTITGVDDAIADGTQTVNISASAGGFTGGSDSVDVTDDDVVMRTLTVTILNDAIGENGGTSQVTVTRDEPDVTAPLDVMLLSSDSGEAMVPAMVQIPANQTSVTFTVTGVDDSIVDGPQVITITASAAGFTDGSDTVEVIDNDGGDLPALAYDFVRTEQAAADGYIPVLLGNEYSTGQGYGWMPGVFEAYDSGAFSADAVHRDYHFLRTGSRTFRVDLANGLYEVVVSTGSAIHRFHEIGVFMNGTQVDQFTTEIGELVDKTYLVSVTNGVLELAIARQGGTIVGIGGLVIRQATSNPVVMTSDDAAYFPVGGSGIAIDPGLTVMDANDVTLAGATVTVSSGFVPGEDQLLFTNQSGITGTYDALNGVLTLSGVATVVEYEAALRGVEYLNTSGTPTIQDRTLTFEVSDGIGTGAADRLLQIIQPATQAAITFDFGTARSAVAMGPGVQGVLPDDNYTSGRGYGWTDLASGGFMESYDAITPDDLLRDYQFFRSGTRTFRADLANGIYDVTVNIGSTVHRFVKIGVLLDGVPVDQVTTEVGQFFVKTYRVSVVNGQFSLTLARNGGTIAAINGLTITPAAPPVLPQMIPTALQKDILKHDSLLD